VLPGFDWPAVPLWAGVRSSGASDAAAVRPEEFPPARSAARPLATADHNGARAVIKA